MIRDSQLQTGREKDMLGVVFTGTLWFVGGALGLVLNSLTGEPDVATVVALAAWMASGAILIAGGTIGIAIKEK